MLVRATTCSSHFSISNWRHTSSRHRHRTFQYQTNCPHDKKSRQRAAFQSFSTLCQSITTRFARLRYLYGD